MTGQVHQPPRPITFPLVTADGPQIRTRFPAPELFVANPY